MKDEDLKDLMNGILQQTENTNKEISLVKAKLAALEDYFKNTEVVDDNESDTEFPEEEGIRFIQKIDDGIVALDDLINKMPKDPKIIHERNLVLFSKNYNEGNYGAKDLIRGVYFFLGTCFLMFLLSKYVPSYLAISDENIAYKNTMQWYYFKLDKKSQTDLTNNLNHFKNKDTLYINQLKRFKQADQARTYE